MADNRSIAETLANDPGLRRMCEETLPGLERMAAPVGAAGVQEILKIPLTGMYGHPKAGGKDKTAEELTVYWIGLMNGLKDLPKAALEEALMSYVKTAQIPQMADRRRAQRPGQGQGHPASASADAGEDGSADRTAPRHLERRSCSGPG
ncbi:MAG: hypothetical protein KKA05_10365 [Alphaproteobacteria bacterium]|nr:hypothetical protein [Alphaproteobacteria bacterium]